MARLGAGAKLAPAGGRWQVFRGNRFGVSTLLTAGGGLGYWWVRETGLKGEPFPLKHRFRVQRDAVMDAAVMNARYP